MRKNELTNEIKLPEDSKKSKESFYYDEGNILNFATDEQIESTKNFSSEMYRLSKQHRRDQKN